MALSPRAKQAQQALPEGVLARVQLTPQKMIMGRIGTSAVERRLLSREVRAVGIVEYDETRRAIISARTGGRLDKLLVNYVGQRVNKGEELALFYSPELVVAQQELLTAVNAGKAGASAGGQVLVDAARNKLLQWGLTSEQIGAIIVRGTVQQDVAISSPIVGIVTEKKALEGQYVTAGQELYTVADLGGVWLQAKIFESDIDGIGPGQAVAVQTTSYPDETFAGRIAFVSYQVDPQTRTISARVEIPNPQYKLKPGMYAVANIRLPVGKVEEVTQAASAPTSAPAVNTEGLVGPYLALAKAYAADKTDEAALNALMTQANELPQGSPDSQRLLAAIHSAVGKNLDAQREAFKAVSTEMIRLLQRNPPSGKTLYIAHCPMVNADWLTDSKEILNPYAGSQMLTCGEIKGELKASASEATDDFVQGYYCPLTPDQITPTSQPCPLDDQPLKLVRRQKVLAVPESAVIDTGTRKVVYRQDGEGVFDMIEVQLGEQAGEYYPVRGGLKEGDLIATAGTFLVDAENRLNPAARVQYSGATGSPEGAATPPAASAQPHLH
jgi:multidrug efflux pump subunit AcrA (membrane-fusion protein)